MHDEIIKSRLEFFKNTEFEYLIKDIITYFEKYSFLINYKVKPRLLHLDLNRGNILVKDNVITGIIDVEESLIGHNEYDLMRTEIHFENEELRTIFFKEYEKYVKLDEGYEKRRPFYSLSRSLVAIRTLILWKDSFSEEDYNREKKRVLELVDKILTTDSLD
jgi:fructosamine-3-kinase